MTAPTALAQALRAYVDARQAAMNDARRGLGINEQDARALLYIDEHPGTRPTELREYLGITSAGVTTLIDRLVQHEAVRRDLDDADRRVNHITATVDLSAEPWSALTRFDRGIAAAIAERSAGEADGAAVLIDALVVAARR